MKKKKIRIFKGKITAFQPDLNHGKFPKFNQLEDFYENSSHFLDIQAEGISTYTKSTFRVQPADARSLSVIMAKGPNNKIWHVGELIELQYAINNQHVKVIKGATPIVHHKKKHLSKSDKKSLASKKTHQAKVAKSQQAIVKHRSSVKDSVISQEAIMSASALYALQANKKSKKQIHNELESYKSKLPKYITHPNSSSSIKHMKSIKSSTSSSNSTKAKSPSTNTMTSSQSVAKSLESSAKAYASKSASLKASSNRKATSKSSSLSNESANSNKSSSDVNSASQSASLSQSVSIEYNKSVSNSQSISSSYQNKSRDTSLSNSSENSKEHIEQINHQQDDKVKLANKHLKQAEKLAREHHKVDAVSTVKTFMNSNKFHQINKHKRKIMNEYEKLLNIKHPTYENSQQGLQKIYKMEGWNTFFKSNEASAREDIAKGLDLVFGNKGVTYPLNYNNFPNLTKIQKEASQQSKMDSNLNSKIPDNNGGLDSMIPDNQDKNKDKK